MARRALLSWLLAVGTGLILLALAPVALVGRSAPAWAPQPVQNWAYDVRLGLGSPARKAASLPRGSLRDNRVYLDRTGRRVQERYQTDY
jgi:hypothetical protein